jgi:hypothetical protein
MKLRYVLLCTLFLFPTLAFSCIAGTYKFKGVSGGGDSYRGVATIVKAGKNVYNARWVYSDNSFDVGTGVLKGDRISFVFANVIGQAFGAYGVITYKIEDHAFKGRYVYFDSTSVGHEKMKKIDHE